MSLYSSNVLTLEDLIERHPDFKWDMEGLSSNQSISPEFVERHPDLKWEMNFLSGNPSITSEATCFATPYFIESHPEGLH